MSAHADLAVELLQAGRADRALEPARRALEEAPDDASLHGLLALCMADSGSDPQETMRVADAGLALDAEDYRCHVAKVVGLLQVGWMYDAAARVRELQRRWPDDVLLWTLLARAMVAAERWQDALQAAESGLRLAPEDVDLRHLATSVRLRLHSRKEELAETRSNLSLDPESADGHQLAAVAAIRHREGGAAVLHARDALRLDPHSRAAHLLLQTACKARHPVYATVAALQARHTRLHYLLVLIGRLALMGCAQAVLVAEDRAQLAVARWPWPAALVAFALMLEWWQRLWDLPLLFDSEFRAVATRADRRALLAQGLLLLLAVIAAAAGLAGMAAGTGAALPLAAAAVHLRAAIVPGRAHLRWVHAAVVPLMLLLGLLGAAFAGSVPDDGDLGLVVVATAMWAVIARWMELAMCRPEPT